MKIQILVDNASSWIVPYASKMAEEISDLGHSAVLLHDSSLITPGDILVLLSCERIFKNLSLNKHNLVVHESALPEGRGWSPLTWQVLEGKTKIPVTLFEAAEDVDSGVIYAQTTFSVLKTDLVDDLRFKQAEATKHLILKFILEYPLTGQVQSGTPSYYKKRRPEDSELKLDKNLSELWPLLQVCDNQRYPAFVIIEGEKFFIRVSKD